jgi:membrane associated rhomboid family serine protease
MNNILQEIKQSFREGSHLTKLIYINLAAFLVIRLLDVVAQLFFSSSVAPLLLWLEMPAQFSVFAGKFWTILTYMFLHFDFLHLLFNVLFLYWFGRLFLSLFNEKQLVGVYLLGGIAGGLFYLLTFNLLPYYQNQPPLPMLGASASAMAIAVACAAAAPLYRVRMLFIGEVRLQYLVLAYVLLDLLGITASSNQGGHIAHLGGALAGYLFVKSWQNGRDLTAVFTVVIDFFVNLLREKPKMKVSFGEKRFTTEQDYRDQKAAENQMIDSILDKIKRAGYDSLTKEEKKALFDKSRQ